MGKRKFKLEVGGPTRLIVGWTKDFDDAWIEVDGERVHDRISRMRLREGVEVAIPDGLTLKVQYRDGGRFKGIDVTHEKRFLPGSMTSPDRYINEAKWTVWVIGSVTVLFGLFMAATGSIEQILTLGSGAAFLVLGHLGSRRWPASFLVASILLGLNIALLALSLVFGNLCAIAPIVVQTLFLRIIWNGHKAIGEEREAYAAA